MIMSRPYADARVLGEDGDYVAALVEAHGPADPSVGSTLRSAFIAELRSSLIGAGVESAPGTDPSPSAVVDDQVVPGFRSEVFSPTSWAPDSTYGSHAPQSEGVYSSPNSRFPVSVPMLRHRPCRCPRATGLVVVTASTPIFPGCRCDLSGVDLGIPPAGPVAGPSGLSNASGRAFPLSRYSAFSRRVAPSRVAAASLGHHAAGVISGDSSDSY